MQEKPFRTLDEVKAGDVPQVEFEMDSEEFGEWLHNDDDQPF